MTNTTTTRRLDFSEARTARYEQNIDTYGEHDDTCVRCGRRTAGELYVEMDTGAGESQGFFTVGPECVKVLKKLGAIVLPASEIAK